jgi:hypothetical protein
MSELPLWKVIGGYTVLGSGPPTMDGEPRWEVRCNSCQGTCVRTPEDVRRNRNGCIRCHRVRMKKIQNARSVAAANKARRKT